jgi:hypothetical protein
MIDQYFDDLDTSEANPLDKIHSKEFAEGLMKAGSFISMLENKRINVTGLFALLLEKKDYQDFFVEITASETFKRAILSLLYFYPSLVKSKITKAVIRKVNAKSSANRIRKISLQQTSSDIKNIKK